MIQNGILALIDVLLRSSRMTAIYEAGVLKHAGIDNGSPEKLKGCRCNAPFEVQRQLSSPCCSPTIPNLSKRSFLTTSFEVGLDPGTDGRPREPNCPFPLLLPSPSSCLWSSRHSMATRCSSDTSCRRSLPLSTTSSTSATVQECNLRRNRRDLPASGCRLRTPTSCRRQSRRRMCQGSKRLM